MERNDWARGSIASATESCRMGSYPMSCQLRLRVVSLKAQFRQDKRQGKTRQLVILLGYEVCSGLLHFRLYRGTDFSGDPKDMPLCNRIPAATVAAFVDECGRMVGLPIQQVLFTQKIMDFTPGAGKVAYLSLSAGRMLLRGRKELAGDNELPCSWDSKRPYRTCDGDHPFIAWCTGTNATELTSYLSDLVKRHNKVVALQCLERAREVLDAMLTRSDTAAKARHGTSRFTVPTPQFHQRIMKHDYVLNDFELREVRFYKREYEDFFAFPGDRGRLAVEGMLGDTAT
ncbi:hypothetical protein ASD07_20340 [Duganella sp. Root336D2]|nr:hypothetical protein ASD07_20340 [Duganella sp. Root336D2]